MRAWEFLLAKSTAPAGSRAWEHLISQLPNVEGNVVPTGVSNLAGHAPIVAVSTNVSIIDSSTIQFAGLVPDIVFGGSPTITVPTGSIAFTSPIYGSGLDESRTFILEEDYRFSNVTSDFREFAVDSVDRYFLVSSESRVKVVK